MQKFITNMLYAIIAYVLIYAILITYMRVTAKDAEQFCQGIQPGMTFVQLNTKAESEGFKTDLMPLKEPQKKILIARKEPNLEATCEMHIENEKLVTRQFIQHVF